MWHTNYAPLISLLLISCVIGEEEEITHTRDTQHRANQYSKDARTRWVPMMDSEKDGTISDENLKLDRSSSTTKGDGSSYIQKLEKKIKSGEKNERTNDRRNTHSDDDYGLGSVLSAKNEAIVDKYIDTLMRGQRYLKMVEKVNQKVINFDAKFHENFNALFKAFKEIMTATERSKTFWVKGYLDELKGNLSNLQMRVSEHLDPSAHIQVTDNLLDNRVNTLQSQVNGIRTGIHTIVSDITVIADQQLKEPTRKTNDPTMILINNMVKTLYDSKNNCDCSKVGRMDRSSYPIDCHEVHRIGFTVPGIYKIQPEHLAPFYVLCDFNTLGGGWTVLQNRFNGTQDFYKGWSDYKNGFGNLAGEFWLGLEKIYHLTNQKLYELRIEMETKDGEKEYATYSVFSIGPENEDFRISSLGSYQGNAGDSLRYHAGQKFSTFDTDNDEWKDGACAVEHGGGWWYKACDQSNLNGRYPDTSDNKEQSMYWVSHKKNLKVLKMTKMMIRPLPTKTANSSPKAKRTF